MHHGTLPAAPLQRWTGLVVRGLQVEERVRRARLLLGWARSSGLRWTLGLPGAHQPWLALAPEEEEAPPVVVSWGRVERALGLLLQVLQFAWRLVQALSHGRRGLPATAT